MAMASEDSPCQHFWCQDANGYGGKQEHIGQQKKQKYRTPLESSTCVGFKTQFLGVVVA